MKRKNEDDWLPIGTGRTTICECDILKCSGVTYPKDYVLQLLVHHTRCLTELNLMEKLVSGPLLRM